jgi:hypothetical protein
MQLAREALDQDPCRTFCGKDAVDAHSLDPTMGWRRGLSRQIEEDGRTIGDENLKVKHRVTPQATTGTAPAELLMGRQIRTHLDLVPNYSTADYSKEEPRLKCSVEGI